MRLANASLGSRDSTPRDWRSPHPLSGSLDGDFDPAILRAALRRIVRSDRPGVAEALGRDAGGRDTLRHKERDYFGGPARRQHQIVRDTLLLQRRSDWKIVRIAVDDNFGVRRGALEFWGNIVGELRLAGRAEPVATLREQQVAGFDERALCLQSRDLCLELIIVGYHCVVRLL